MSACSAASVVTHPPPNICRANVRHLSVPFGAAMVRAVKTIWAKA
jgi:hypothetical protein